MLAWRAARTAARSRGFAAGSGRPVRAAVVSSRMILVKTLARFLSCAPLRYMMFLNCEWPAIDLRAALRRHQGRKCSAWPWLTIQYGSIAAPRIAANIAYVCAEAIAEGRYAARSRGHGEP